MKLTNDKEDGLAERGSDRGSERGLEGLRALLVEDESMVALLLESMLEDLGVEVQVAMRLPEGLRLAQDGAFDFAVLDVNLGGSQRSDPIAEVLRARRLPFVFCTGYGERGLSPSFRGTPTLQKPFEVADLRKIVSRLLG